MSGYDTKENVADFYIGGTGLFQIDWAEERMRLDNAQDILREYGVVFPFRGPMPDAHMEGGFCFRNALTVTGKARKVADLVYCEGVLLAREFSSGCPLSLFHAWCYSPRLKTLIDPTAPKLAGCGFVTYVGVPFNFVYAADTSYNNDSFGLFDGARNKGSTLGKDPVDWWLHPCWKEMERYYGPL